MVSNAHPFPTLASLQTARDWSELRRIGHIYIDEPISKISLFGRDNHQSMTITLFSPDSSYFAKHTQYRIELTEGYSERQSLDHLLDAIDHNFLILIDQLTDSPFSECRFGVCTCNVLGFKVTRRHASESTVINPFNLVEASRH